MFTLGGGVQLLCAAFDMPVTGVALKVALGYKKNVFWAFQKNNHGHSLDNNLHDYLNIHFRWGVSIVLGSF